jgi:hypothetical protein
METRFLSHVNKTDTCWLWTSSTFRNGYGQFKLDGKNRRANRVAYELWVGEIPDGLVVRHKCLHKGCVNPEHLETGTDAENIADKQRDGTQNRGQNHGRAKLTDEQVAEVRRRRANGETGRSLAHEFGVDVNTICRIHLRKYR